MRSPSLLFVALLGVGAALPSGRAYAADPTTAECLAASEAALTSANDHKLRRERTQLLVCAASSCPGDVRKECSRRVEEVNAQIPTIVFVAKDGSGKDLSAVRVSMDGEVLAEQLDGTALPIDPGEHTFTFEVTGQPPLQKQFLIRESQKDQREPITLGSAPPSPSPSPSPGLGTQKILALVAGGVGVVGLGIGSAFGLMAMSKKSDAQGVCSDACSSSDGVNKWSDAKSAGDTSTVAFVVGGVALAGGLALWLTAKPESSTGVTALAVGPGFVQVKGAW